MLLVLSLPILLLLTAHSQSLCLYSLSLPQESRHLAITRLFQGKTLTSKSWCIQAHTVTKHSETRKIKDLSSGWQAESSPGVKQKPATLKCNFPHPVIQHTQYLLIFRMFYLAKCNLSWTQVFGDNVERKRKDLHEQCSETRGRVLNDKNIPNFMKGNRQQERAAMVHLPSYFWRLSEKQLDGSSQFATTSPFSSRSPFAPHLI